MVHFSNILRGQGLVIRVLLHYALQVRLLVVGVELHNGKLVLVHHLSLRS
jgi:hypothetical protein